MDVIEDFETQVKPLKFTLRNILQLVLIIFIAFITLIGVIFSVYIIACYLDRELPIEVFQMSAADTVKGEPFHYHFDAYRKKSCELEVYKYATDVKGQQVYSNVDQRPTNGGKRRYIVDDDYKLNGKETPGTATFHIFFRWKCPGNIVHNWKPLEKEFTDNFEIYASQENKDKGIKSIYVPPEISPEEKPD